MAELANLAAPEMRRRTLLPPDEGLHVGGRDQPHLMAELANLAAPEMRRRTLPWPRRKVATRRKSRAPGRAAASS